MKIDKLKKLKNKVQEDKSLRELISLLKVWKNKKILKKLNKAKTGEELLKLAEEVKITKKIGKGGNAILIEGGKEIGEGIKVKFLKDGWNKTKTTSDMVVLEKGKEKIIFRRFDSSEGKGSYPGYKHEMTIEVLRYEGSKGLYGKPISKEIKIILPK